MRTKPAEAKIHGVIIKVHDAVFIHKLTNKVKKTFYFLLFTE